MEPRLKKFLLSVRNIIGWGALAFIIVQVILAGYTISWTGFGEYTLSNGDFVLGKKLWDWMELLIIPLVLAIGAFYLNRSERAVERQTAEDRAKLEREITTDRQQEAALQAYLDRMADLLLKENLRVSENEELRNVARIRTLTILRGLDAKRKGIVLLFLTEANLITYDIEHKGRPRIINLTGADLSRAYLVEAILAEANLAGANLNESNMREAFLMSAFMQATKLNRAYLSKAILVGAVLLGADMQGTDLREANLIEAKLIGANLSGAQLAKANLTGADLGGADLTEADLSGADLTRANLGPSLESRFITRPPTKAKVTSQQLATVKSLTGATMPDGTIHD
jgi:uncharacterized protein YjbI with pentapeptide repeats